MAGRPGVDLVTVFKNSIPADFVLTYHSTIVMNVWDGRYLYCLWPDLTFNGLYVRNMQTPTQERIKKALQKYQGRGFRDKYDPQGLLLREPLGLDVVPAHYIQDDMSPEGRERRLELSDIRGPRWRMPLELSLTW
ncbi:hypothetical protein BDP27DRAFT_1335569 [Rhodocollybia butyracea]|uniref:Uncharacterized protein n=1 Tax=Rhodocollybia butyracea TaxID=206335 RepID=A0A9P5PJG2_9AGAR|nr:hypothetical protein BDP27DRAFT_1335569 [Rhodocollybia butyracea]